MLFISRNPFSEYGIAGSVVLVDLKKRLQQEKILSHNMQAMEVAQSTLAHIFSGFFWAVVKFVFAVDHWQDN